MHPALGVAHRTQPCWDFVRLPAPLPTSPPAVPRHFAVCTHAPAPPPSSHPPPPTRGWQLDDYNDCVGVLGRLEMTHHTLAEKAKAVRRNQVEQRRAGLYGGVPAPPSSTLAVTVPSAGSMGLAVNRY